MLTYFKQKISDKKYIKAIRLVANIDIMLDKASDLNCLCNSFDIFKTIATAQT